MTYTTILVKAAILDCVAVTTDGDEIYTLLRVAESDADAVVSAFAADKVIHDDRTGDRSKLDKRYKGHVFLGDDWTPRQPVDTRAPSPVGPVER